MCLCKIKYWGGVSHHFGGVLTSLKKYRAIWGIAAIVSRDMGPLTETHRKPTLSGNKKFPKKGSEAALTLAAQSEIPPPHRAQDPFEIVSQRGVSHAFCLVCIGYRASIAEIPLLRGGGGYRTSTSHALKGGIAQKRGRGYRTRLAMLRHQKTP